MKDNYKIDIGGLAWVPVKKPFSYIKVFALIFSPFFAMTFIGIALFLVHGDRAPYWKELIGFTALPTGLLLPFTIIAYFMVVVEVTINRDFLGIRYPPNRIRFYDWEDFKELYYGEGKTPVISLKLGHKNHRVFNIEVAHANQIIQYWEKATKKKAESFDAHLERMKKKG